MVEFVSPDIYEEKLFIIETETLIIKDLSQIILSYDCVCLRPGMRINCRTNFDRLYFATCLMVTTNSAIVCYDNYNDSIQEVRFYQIRSRNRNEIIEFHLRHFQREQTTNILKNDLLMLINTLENEGFPLNHVVSCVCNPLYMFSLDIMVVRQRVKTNTRFEESHC
jgi:hypothetical protein